MHAGNIYAALVSWLAARSLGGTVVFRIEDLDKERSKPHWCDQIKRDFETLGLTWDKGPFYQSDHDEVYEDAVKQLETRGLLYPCFCTRHDLAASRAPHHGEKPVYPGTCAYLSAQEREEHHAAGKRYSLRLRVPHVTIKFNDALQGLYRQELSRQCGDFVVKRSDGAFAYQLAVVIDDAYEGVNLVVRGVDLLNSTPQQIYLRSLLGLSQLTDEVRYAHVPLFVAERFRRLSKRDKDAELDEMLAHYKTPERLIGHIAYLGGIIDKDEPVSPHELVAGFSLSQLKNSMSDPLQIFWKP